MPYDDPSDHILPELSYSARIVIICVNMGGRGSVAALPLRQSRNGEQKAFWGMHDISARARLPKDIMSLAVPLEMACQMHANIERSFLRMSQWSKIVKRHSCENAQCPAED